MRHEAEFERWLADWIESGPYTAPDRAIERAIGYARTHRQRRVTRSALWRSVMDRMHLTPAAESTARPGWLFAAAIVAVVLIAVAAIGSGIVRLSGNQDQLPAVGGPSAPASVAPTPTSAKVTGSEACTTTSTGTSTIVGDVTDYRGVVLECTDTMSDPRVSGTGTVAVSIDERADESADIWGTYTLRNDGGTWAGRWNGTVDKGYTTHRVEGLLTGTGSYAGLVYRIHLVSEDGANATVTGTIEAAGTPISGTETCTETDGGLPPVNARDFAAYRGIVLTCTDTTSDPRVSSTETTIAVSVDERADESADVRGTSVVRNANGSWEGRWSGTVDPGYTTHHVDAILVGSGAYAGLEYRLHVEGTGNPTYSLTGTIVPSN